MVCGFSGPLILLAIINQLFALVNYLDKAIHKLRQALAGLAAGVPGIREGRRGHGGAAAWPQEAPQAEGLRPRGSKGLRPQE